ncbi:Heterokaryon incompatibility [Hyphodiscus hymeniophilus]|uniref:Heterokaryon incompatibility n=1 Tax=Hyphodiscus hymeniophilus TaxID=353542 RepID=A0A9P7AXU6_9HELO|nr:Heterokaryon incompatibility [Hyphodiscus hymeniophilus]
MAIYSACALDHPDSIRIVLLKPSAQAQSDVHCELQSISLSSIATDEELKYTSLSYAWGDTRKTRSIFVSDEKLEIGANLFSALQNLRRQDRPIRLWVDALSINQNDPDERSQQVQQMRGIYATASETVIYLGPDDGSAACRSAWTFLESRSSWAMNDHRDHDKTLPQTRKKDVNLKTAYNDVLDTVISRDWFTRIWVIQEMVVSQYLSIQCGNRKVPWNDFCRTLFLYFSPLSTKSGYDPQNKSYSAALESLQSLAISENSQIAKLRPGWEVVARQNSGWEVLIQPIREICQTRLLYQRAVRDPNLIVPAWVLNNPLAHFVADDTEFRQGSLRLVHLLAKSRKLHATDPRDKTFALLGISTPLGSANIQSLVDYNKPVHQTYREITHFILEAEGTLDILSQAGLTSQHEDLDFSSWAGRWSERDFPPSSVLSRLGGESEELTKMRSLTVSQHHAWSNDNRILGCTGGILGELVAVGELGISSQTKTSVDDSDDLFERWKEFIPSATALVEGSKWTIADQNSSFRVTKVIKNRAQGHFHINVSSSSESGERSIDEDIFIAGGSGFISDVFALREGRMLAMVRSVRQVLGGNATDKDATYSWGVVPRSAKVGDWVATITGSSVLFLLHPQPEEGRRNDVDEEFRASLPRHTDEDTGVIHCRLRGECRFSGFEENWNPISDMSEEDSKRPWMTYIGWIPRQFRAAIFALH